jgi:hypothetical protein
MRIPNIVYVSFVYALFLFINGCESGKCLPADAINVPGVYNPTPTFGVTSTEGSWEAGVNGAQPGVVMETPITVGHAYRQEYSSGVAEDLFEIIGTGESVSVPYGDFTDTVTTREWTPLEPCFSENKYYALGAGLVRVVMTKGGSEEVHLTAKTP